MVRSKNKKRKVHFEMFKDPNDLTNLLFVSAAEVSQQKTQPVLAKTGEFLIS